MSLSNNEMNIATVHKRLEMFTDKTPEYHH